MSEEMIPRRKTRKKAKETRRRSNNSYFISGAAWKNLARRWNRCCHLVSESIRKPPVTNSPTASAY